MSGPWLARRYRRALERTGRVLPQCSVTGELVTHLARQGDAQAKEVVTQAGQALGAAIASMSMVLDVELFVIGSSVARAGDLLLEPARAAIPRHCYESVSCRVRVEATHLCASMRGVRKPGMVMTTSAVLGLFRKSDKTRAEFFSHLERPSGGAT